MINRMETIRNMRRTGTLRRVFTLSVLLFCAMRLAYVAYADGVGRKDVLGGGVQKAVHASEPEATEEPDEIVIVMGDCDDTPLQEKDPLSEEEAAVAAFLAMPTDDDGTAFTQAGIAAVMGIIRFESGMDPTATNPYDGGYGLLQWTDTKWSDRKQAMLGFCAGNGMDPDSVDGQLSYFVEELKTRYSTSAGYTYPVYETLTTSDSVYDCLHMLFCHNVAGTDVRLSRYEHYAGGMSTQALFDDRLDAANDYFERI